MSASASPSERRRRGARRLALGLLLACLAAGGVLAQRGGGEPASPSFLERQLQALVPGLRVEGLEGAWRAAPRARRITLSDPDGVWLEIVAVRLAIAPAALFRGVLRLEGLEAERVALRRLPVADPAAPPPAPAGTGSVLPSLPDLPVDLALDRLAVARVEIAAAVAGQAAAFALDGRARLGDGRLTAGLALRRLDAEGSATLELALDPPQDRLAAGLALREPPGGLGPTLLGLQDQPLALDLRLDGPAAAGAALTLEASLGPAIGLTASGTLRAGGGTGAAGALGAVLEGEARFAPLLPAATAALASPARFALDAERPGGTAVVTLRRLALTLPGGTVTAAGTLDTAREQPDVALRLALAEPARFAGLLPAGLGWEAAAAEARITGTLAAPAIALAVQPAGLQTGLAAADAVLGPAPRLAGTLALPGPSVDLALRGAAGLAALRASLGAALDATLRLDLPELAVLGEGSTGALAVEARATGAMDDPRVTLAARSGRIGFAGRRLEALDLTALVETPRSAPRAEAALTAALDGIPLRLALRGQPEGPGRLRLDRAEARIGADAATLDAAGLLETDALLFAGEARLRLREAGAVGRLAGLPGLTGRGSLTAVLAPHDGIQGFDLRLDVPLLAHAGMGVAGLTARLAGTPAGADWDLRAGALSGLPVELLAGRGRIAIADGAQRLDLAALSATVGGEALRLAAPATLARAADGGLRLTDLTILGPRGGRLRAAGRWGPEEAALEAAVEQLSLGLVERFAPDIRPRGVVNGTIRVRGTVARPVVQARLTGTGLGAGAPWGTGLPPLAMQAEANLAETGAAALRAAVEAGPAGRLEGTAALPRGFGAGAPLEAALSGRLDLGRLAGPFLAAGGDRVRGTATLALRATGPIEAPVPAGRITLAGGDYRNPVQGLHVSGIGGAILVEGTRLTLSDLRGRAGPQGSLAVQGRIEAAAADLPVDLTLTARTARPLTSPLGSAAFDADLRLAGPMLAAGGALRGTVAIRGAELRIPESLPASVPVLPGVRARGRPPPGAVPPAAPQPAAGPGTGLPPIALAVAVTTPEPIFVRGRGIDAELGGEVTLGGTLAEPVPSGGLTLRRGRLDILARQLTLQRGQIAFATGRLLPVLDLAAVSRTRTATVTVSVQGTPAAPEVRFTSVPELPQDEVLSRLLFDRPTSNLSPFEIAQLAQAVAQLTGVEAGEGVVDTLRGALGLDRLGVTSDAEGRAAVEAGRTVAPGVYLGVRQGVQGQTGVAVQVEVTPRLRLEGQTATGPAGDRLGLSYEIEY